MNSVSLRLDSLDVAYGVRQVLSQLRLAEVLPGQLVGVLGANGAGKSTLLRAVARMTPARGEVHLGGLDLLRCRHDELVRQVAYLPQTLPQATSLRVLELIAGALRATRPDLPAQERDGRVHAVLHQLQLTPLALERLDRLSGGQRQRVGIAQLLVRRAPLMLLDEPTSALDLRWQLQTLEALRHAAQERGAIACVALHDLNLAARFCDRLVLLGSAGLVAEGTPREVLTSALLLQAFQVEAHVQLDETGDIAFVRVERASTAPRFSEPAPA